MSDTENKEMNTNNWPLRNVDGPLESDVMCGRGAGSNHHLGNKRYRQMVERRKAEYEESSRLDKPLVALDIVKQWRAQSPPGRFLKYNERTDKWDDVGDRKARLKTSQALREKPRKEDDAETPPVKESERPTVQPPKPPLIVRGHTLGSQLLTPAEADLRDFTWNDSFKNDEEHKDDSSIGCGITGIELNMVPSAVFPPTRESSMGSVGSFFKDLYDFQSSGNLGLPQYDSLPGQYPVTDASTPDVAESQRGNLTRPGIIKRDTSNEIGTMQPSIKKRAFYNREKSATSNSLKQQMCMPALLSKIRSFGLKDSSNFERSDNIGVKPASLDFLEKAAASYGCSSPPPLPQPCLPEKSATSNSLKQQMCMPALLTKDFLERCVASYGCSSPPPPPPPPPPPQPCLPQRTSTEEYEYNEIGRCEYI